MTAVELWNLALIKIGQSQGVSALDDESRAAWTGDLVYDTKLRETLRRFPWGFATKYALLDLVRGLAWDDDAQVQAWDATYTYAIGDIVEVGGTFYYATAASTNQTPPNASYWTTDSDDLADRYQRANFDWLYGYRWPTDCLFVRRAKSNADSGRTFDATPTPFRIGRDVNGLLIFTNQQATEIEYTVIDCDNLWADDIFLNAFTWNLAALAAPTLSRNGLTAEDCLRHFETLLMIAATVSSREQQLEKPGEAEHIRAR
jgi:hypothetical protein